MGKWTNLKSRVELKIAFASAYEAKKDRLIKEQPKINFNMYLNEILFPKVAFEELDGDRFELAELDQKAIIRDRYLRRSFDVSLIEGRIFCEPDQSDACVHVFYCQQHPRVKKILKDRGLA